MPQITNLNVAPYYDDYSLDRNYHRVLFKPGNSIQARELTTLQSILQNQIEKFGQHFFKDGAMVVPGDIGYDSNYTCVEINSVHLGIPVSAYLNQLVGKTITGEISNVTARIESVISDNESERKNNTLYIKYLTAGGLNLTNTTFVDGENLIIQELVEYSAGTLNPLDSIATTLSSNSTSTGSAIKIASGIYFIRGFFVNVSEQTLILDQYDNSPSYRVGLYIKESFAVASNEYKDLLDNSQGFYNFAAPGADRLVIEVELFKKPLTDTDDTNFVQLIKLENGEIEYVINRTEYSRILEEFARRTYDESGDYYIQPFQIEIKESLNNYLGNNGIYDKSAITKNGNAPSDDLACVSISPGKAYVRGYEVEKIRNTLIDYEKPRTTETAQNQVVQFNFGTQIELNNVYGSIPVGLTTSSHIKLFNSRTNTVGISTGKLIGVAKLYDLKLQASQYKDASSVFDASLYDIQTYTTLNISDGFSEALTASTYIEGRNSGANGYLVSGITTTTTEFDLHQVSGTFMKNEALITNGNETNIIVKDIRDYSLNDVHQITSYNTISTSFTADPVLSRTVELGNNFTITGLGTITSSNDNFYLNVKTGDIISYTKPGDILPTYNVIKTVGLTSIIVGSAQTVQGVNVGSLPASTITVNSLKKVTLDVKNNNTKLYSKLNNEVVSSLNLATSSVYLRKTIPLSINNSTVFEASIFEGSIDDFLLPFDEEAYTLVYSDGTIESLTSQKIFPNVNSSNSPAQGRITLRNLSTSSLSGTSQLTITYQKINCKTRKKAYNRCSTLTIDKTRVGINTVGTGLTKSNVYGIRVEDEVISLNVPEVYSLVGIFESTTSSNPILPSFTVSSSSGNIVNLIKGEKIIGKDSNAIATVVSNDSINKVVFCYLNDNNFNLGETVTFEESGITATVSSLATGDPNIINSYDLDTGSRDSYFDFSRIIRKSSAEAPTRRITIVYNNYSIDSNDTGTFIGVNSYESNQYKDIPVANNLRYSDILDFRPRVSSYDLNSSYSPFDFTSRVFSSNSSSSNFILAKDTSLILSYNYYLPRRDKLFLTSDGKFNLVKGVPSLSPNFPSNLDYSLEIASIYSPAYVFNVSDIKVNTLEHKRYTMKDISKLDERLSNVETYTSLSLLESQTQNIQIIDLDTKLNRFKSGFFVDSFNSSNNGDVESPLYRASVDLNNHTLRPQPYNTFIDLEFNPNTSSNIKQTGSILSLNYNNLDYITSGIGTNLTYESQKINQFNLTDWNGLIELEPSYDSWKEEKYEESNKTWNNLNNDNSYIRTKNIGINAKCLKPFSALYAFFDDIDVTKYIVPERLGISMLSGIFIVGETVTGEYGNSYISFKLANTTNYYNGTSSELIVDIDSLNSPAQAEYYGNVEKNMTIRGTTSGAKATIIGVRLFTDIYGNFIGSLFIPDPKISSNPKFKVGTKTFILNSVNSTTKPNTANFGYAEALFNASTANQLIGTNDLSIRKSKLISETAIDVNRDSEFLVSLAQSFFVNEASGVFLTQCDLFFTSKPQATATGEITILPQGYNIPVLIQIRTMINGKPSSEIVPFSEVVLYNRDIITQIGVGNGETKVTFKSPVYLEGNREYCIVLKTNTEEYTLRTIKYNETTFKSRSINVGNLFKSQNTTFLIPSQYESLKFKLYRADFDSQNMGTVNFYNSDNLNSNTIGQLSKSYSIQSYSRTLRINLNKDLNSSQINLLSSGYPLTQTSNTDFTSKVIRINGKLSPGYNLSIIGPGAGYTAGITSYTDVGLISLTGTGSGAKATIGVGTGVVYSAVVSTPGSNYSIGDIVTIDYKDTNNLGNSVILSIPSSSGILTAFNSLIVNEAQGNLTVSSGDLIVNGTTLTGVYPAEAPIVISDGLHFKVNSKNHGMYSTNNMVNISGVESDIPFTYAQVSLGTSTGTLSVNNTTNFTKFEGSTVGVANTGYLKIGKEIIGYTGVNTSLNEISISTRGVDGTTVSNISVNDSVFKYEFNGISLRKINKQHSLANVDYSKYSINLDSYYVKIQNVDNKYFKTNKSLISNSVGIKNPLSISQNIAYSILNPIITAFAPDSSALTSRIQTYGATSVNGTEPSFIDKGFQEFSLSSENAFKDFRGIFSKINESEYMNSNKSLNLRFNLSTTNSKVSPIIDLDQIGLISTMNRIDKPIQDYTKDSRVNTPLGDPNSSIYVSKKINLTKPADSLKVIFDAYVHSSNDLRVAYRAFRSDVEDDTQTYELFPGYGNLDTYGNTIDESKNSGLPDTLITPSGNENELKQYEYNVKTSFPFTGYQIKIIMTGTDQANVPKIKNLKTIATI